MEINLPSGQKKGKEGEGREADYEYAWGKLHLSLRLGSLRNTSRGSEKEGGGKIKKEKHRDALCFSPREYRPRIGQKGEGVRGPE